ncbi:MAG TPA: DEAD/DEAH box helicase [Desulfobacteraceae bacterium]|nr:DEAD/DEAH box helicase [Desulfobacteraceae bacterium]
MSIAEYVSALKQYRRIAPDIVYHKTLPPQPGKYADRLQETAKALPAIKLFEKSGIKALYSHQKEAVNHIIGGRHTLAATPTASGKSLIYNLPVVDELVKESKSRALYLFPLKALARDQLGKVQNLLNDAMADFSLSAGLTAQVYDGDLSSVQKGKIRKNPPNILLTNPEMLHLAMLAHHHLWENFFRELKFVVVDEVHTYRGIMGSHMAWVFRRLRRICRFYGCEPVFVFCSATIGNPGELAEQLTALPVEVVQGSHAPSGKKEVLLVNSQNGAAQTAIELIHAAVSRNIRTIVYTQSRKITELISMWAATRAGELGNRISAYRAGFLSQERRKIESKLASGELLAVVSTSALELGIDIGNLDLCILVGYPGTIMSTWQRAGRVGRGSGDSATIFLANEDALDLYFMNNPHKLFDMPPEKAIINPYNSVIMQHHLECAAADLPLERHETMLEAEAVKQALTLLEQDARLLKDREGTIWYASRKAPHRHVSLRGTGRSIPIFLSQTKKSIGDVDWSRAFYETHEGAVYLHHGHSHVVTRFDHQAGLVEVEQKTVPYFTRPRSSKSTTIVTVYDEKRVWETRIGFGRLRVNDQVTGYERKLVKNQKSLGVVPLDLPCVTFETEGLWIEIPDGVRGEMEKENRHFMGGIHALEHAAIGILPVMVMTDRNDLGGISIPFHGQTQKAAVFVYDGAPGGMGLARQAFYNVEEILEATLETVKHCPCEIGCPACVHSPKCGSGNRPIDKDAAVTILEKMKTATHRETFAPIPLESATNPAETDQPGSPGKVEAAVEKEGNEVAVVEEREGGGAPQKNRARPGREIYYGVLDIETRRSAKDVGGWFKADKMGVSCAVLYDSQKDHYFTYFEENVKALETHLAGLDLVIGFNIKKFDYKVLSGISDFNYTALPTLDLLVNIHKRLGYRLALDNLAGQTLGVKKSADGLAALQWWKEGKIEKIVAYCQQDVRVTKDLYLFGRENSFVLFQNKAEKTVRVPVTW